MTIDRGVLNNLCYGENHYDVYSQLTDDRNGMKTIHAEADCLNRLSRKLVRSRRRRVDLFVFRISSSGKLGNSKPCANCIEKMNNVRGYKIVDVYYSNSEGEIEKKKLSQLDNVASSYFTRM